MFSNYLKSGHNMTLVIDKAQKDLVSVSIVATYLDSPSDEVHVSVQFTNIPGGSGHVSSATHQRPEQAVGRRCEE